LITLLRPGAWGVCSQCDPSHVQPAIVELDASGSRTGVDLCRRLRGAELESAVLCSRPWPNTKQPGSRALDGRRPTTKLASRCDGGNYWQGIRAAASAPSPVTASLCSALVLTFSIQLKGLPKRRGGALEPHDRFVLPGTPADGATSWEHPPRNHPGITLARPSSGRSTEESESAMWFAAQCGCWRRKIASHGCPLPKIDTVPSKG